MRGNRLQLQTFGTTLALLCLLVGAACDSKTDTTAATDSTPETTALDDTAGSDSSATATDGMVQQDSQVAEDGFVLDLQLPDVLDCPGATGCSCTEAGDCNTGFCVETTAGLRCAPLCTSDCGPGFVCRSAPGEPVNYCAPLGVRDCAPCTSNASCNGAGAVPAVCASAGDAGSFCATVCLQTSDCPSGSSCGLVAGQTSKVCLPDGGLAACTCSDWAKSAKASTTCSVPDGSLACPGSRGCSDAGLSACTLLAGELCIDVGCAKAPDGATCVDDDPCTADTTCKSGVCQGGNSVCECKTTADCSGKEDGNLCNGTLFCDAASNSCKVNPATVVSCAKPTSPCDAVACEPTTGKCATTALPDNSACDDGKACTAGDYCASGKCVSGTVTCVCGSDADCAPLEDGNACNGKLFCNKVKGQCQLNPATAVICPSGKDTACSTNVCDKATGSCSMVAAANAKACDDGNSCTGGDACQDGQCMPSTLTCACTEDEDCKAQEDGNLCNGTLFCDVAAGNCKVNPATVIGCVDNGSACAPAQCDPETGKCATTALPDGSPCNDGDACTQSEACKAGTCASGANLCACVTDGDCAGFEDGNACNGTLYCDKTNNTCAINGASVVSCPSASDTPCNRNTCDPATGICSMTTVADGGVCEDGNPCTGNEFCTDAQCGGGISVCQCAQDADCAGQDDGNLCNGVWYCDKSGVQTVCKFNPATAVTCVDADTSDCEVAVCLPATGTCTTAVAANAAACDDANPCTQGDTCTSGQCSGALAAICDDNDACTADGCDPTSGCTHGPVLEVCDGKDNDCDGTTDEADATGCSVWYVDADKDGFATPEPSACLCSKPDGLAGQVPGKDCDDANEAVFPSAIESCNDIDDNCDETIDDDGSTGCVSWYADTDGDTYGDANGATVCRCVSQAPPMGYTTVTGDCNPSNNGIFPGATEVCNGQDDDCDTAWDEDFDFCSNPNFCGGCGFACMLANAEPGCSCASGLGASCTVAKCNSGWVNLNGVHKDGCEYACTATGEEACDSIDNDCDGQTDEGADPIGCTPYYQDLDSDGWGGVKLGCQCGLAKVIVGGDCDDTSATINPGATAICDNAIDNNCNGTDDSTEACVCSNASRAGPDCIACAPGYKETSPGQCGVEFPLWGNIAASGWTGDCQFLDGANSVAQDPRTGLAWRSVDSMPMPLGDLLAACKVPYGGFNDWRPPTMAEMMTITVTDQQGLAVAACVDPIYMTSPDMPWMTATFWFQLPGAEPPVYINYALTPVMGGGFANDQLVPGAAGDQGMIACVRGGNFAPYPATRWTIEPANDTLHDALTGLTWEHTAHPNVLTAEAEGYCASVTTGGGNWRLPTAAEASTLIDYGKNTGGFAGGQMAGLGGGDPMLANAKLWTSTFQGISGRRMIATQDSMQAGEMDDMEGGYQIACVKAQ